MRIVSPLYCSRIGRLVPWGACVVMLAVASWADAQAPNVASTPDLEHRVQELETVIRQMRTEQDGQTTAQAAPSPIVSGDPSSRDGKDSTAGQTPPDSGTASPRTDSKASSPKVAGWDDGFFLQSADKAFMLRITGQIQVDYRDFLDNQDRTDIDTFLIRRARLGIEATMAKYYEFRLLPDFGGTNPQITDAYLNVHYTDDMQLEVGKFKQPFSYEQLIQDRYVPTLERSMIDQLVPARDEGVMLWGRNLFADQLDYGISVSNGEINGNIDTNNNKDFNGRLAIRPFFTPDESSSLRRLQLGMSAGAGIENEPVNPNTLRTPATVPWFAYNTTVRADGVRYRMSPEVAYFNGPLGFAAQYYHEEQELRANSLATTPAENVISEGYYFLITYFLTGEERTEYSQQIVPLRPLKPSCFGRCPGAWELVFRMSHIELSPNVFRAGPTRLADPAKYSRAATETTFGFNWYWNKWARMQFNWEHAWFEQQVALGLPPDPFLNHQDTLYARMQFIF